MNSKVTHDYSEREVLVAVNSQGMFFGLDEGRNCTNPFMTTEIHRAYHVIPYNKDDLLKPREATYYFEKSDRMKRWLHGYTMVGYRIIVRTEVEYGKLAE